MYLRHLAGVLAISLFIGSCATYNQLKPKALLVNSEGGYIELKKDAKDFVLKKDKKYFISFPAPTQDNFYLVLSLSDKQKFGSFFTNSLLKKKSPGAKISDETPYPDTVSVYPLSKSATMGYWIIDRVPQEMALNIKYRYTPQWRYKFETQYKRFEQTLASNRVNRSCYDGLGKSHHMENVNFPLAMDTVGRHLAELDKVHKELLAIESIFPASILNSSDVAYQNYLKLRKELDSEIEFQTVYRLVLDFYYKESQTRGNALDLLAKIDDFIVFFEQKNRLTANALKECQSVVSTRFAELPAAYEQRLNTKDDAAPFDPDFYKISQVNKVKTLFEKAGLTPSAELLLAIKYVTDFDAKSRACSAIRDSLASISAAAKACPPMPNDDFFRSIVTRMSAVQAMGPTPMDAQYGKYANLACTAALNKLVNSLRDEFGNAFAKYKQAEISVPVLNGLKAQRDFSGMIVMLKQNAQLFFLSDKYREVDRLSIVKQGEDVLGSLNTGLWGQAEAELFRLNRDVNFLELSAVASLKDETVRDLEDSLYSRVERITRSKVNAFLEEKIIVLDSVDALYNDSVFFPAYDIKFSSGSKANLIERKNQLVADLATMKTNEFPAKAVKLLFDQFIKNPDDNGVLKARAMVVHGTHYLGNDKEIKQRIAECDPNLPKWIVKAKEYRRVFALPITDKRTGKNRYKVRLNVNIPTEAVFPVYDVNIKLPKEVAQNAATEQWYDEISMNKKPLKNEGRFSIIAPSATNDWECQITPVQMNKDGSNILDITFTTNGFKVIPVSVMVQKPIIKKN